MPHLSSRPYTGASDLQAMISLTNALRLRGQRIYPTAADLFEELADPDVQVTARLWEDGQRRLVGFAYVNRYQNLVDVFSAHALTPAVESEMMDWVTAAVQRRNQARGIIQMLDASALESDRPRQAFLKRHGFEPQVDTTILLACSLEGPLPGPQLPPGFTIRPMAGDAEVEAYVALHRAAFGTEIMTVDYRRTIMVAPSYIPELDLVAVAPDGQLAAFCVCQIFPGDAPRAGGRREGWTDPMGTHPAYRRLGLAKALLLSGMRLLKARGIDTALLGTNSTNLAMQAAAGSVGFRRVSTTMWYSKAVEPVNP